MAVARVASAQGRAAPPIKGGRTPRHNPTAMSFLFEAPAFYMQAAPSQPRFSGNVCGSALVPQVWDTVHVELDDGYEERARSAHRQQVLKRKEQRAFAELVQQLAIEEVENQRREQRRRVIEAKKAALAEARRQEAAERRRAEAARKRHLAKMHAAQIRQALWEAARAEEAQRIAHAQQLALRQQAQRCAEQKRLAQVQAQAQTQQDKVRYVRIGDLLLRIVENDEEEEYSDAQEDANDNNEETEETETTALAPLTSGNDAEDKVEEEVAVALAKLSAHDRPDEEVQEPEQQIESPDASDDEHNEAVAQACQALADAITTPASEPESENAPAPTETASLEASAPVADAPSANADPVLLFSRDFPSNDTEYGREIRKLVNANSITVEASRANGGSIKIGGLWKMQAPERVHSPPRSPRSARVSDVDENGEEVVVPVVDVQTTNELDASKIKLDDTDTIPLPEHLDGLRAELTDDGFRLWLDSA